MRVQKNVGEISSKDMEIAITGTWDFDEYR